MADKELQRLDFEAEKNYNKYVKEEEAKVECYTRMYTSIYVQYIRFVICSAHVGF